MPHPQIEDGHLDIANEIVEKLMKTQLSGYEWRYLWALWRKTWCWKKKEDWISNSQFTKMTGLYKSHITRTEKRLIERKIVTKIGNKVGFQTNLTQWEELPKLVTFTKIGNKSSVLGQKEEDKDTFLSTKVTKIGNKVTKIGQSVTNFGFHTYTKETIQKKDIYSPLEEFSKEIIKVFNDTFKKSFRVLPSTSYGNFTYWLTVYSQEEILQAIKNSIYDPFWKDKVEPVWFFRRKNPKGEPVDYIGKMLNIKPPKIQSSKDYWLQAANEKRAEYGEQPLTE